MTLGLTLNTRWQTLHTGDRLVSQGLPGGRHHELDSEANKLIVFQARDAALLITYAGAAYVEGKTTDLALAESLANEDLDGQLMMKLPKNGHRWPTFEGVLDRMSRLIGGLGPGPPGTTGLQVAVCGWRWKRDGRLKSVMWRFERAESPEPSMTWWSDERYWAWDRTWHLLPTGIAPSGDAERTLSEDLDLAWRKGPHAMVHELQRAVRESAPRSAGAIGDRAIGVRMLPGSLKVEIYCAPPSLTKLHGEAAGYTPWIMAKSGIWGPSAVSGRGGWTPIRSMTSGPAWNIDIVTADPVSGGRQAAQPRPRPEDLPWA